MKDRVLATALAAVVLLWSVALAETRERVAQASPTPRPPPGVALSDAKHLIQIIKDDPAKLKAWCEMATKAADVNADANALMDAVDPGYRKVMDELNALEDDSPEDRAIRALFLELGRSCPTQG
jgi:hypothetical protein